LPSAPRKQQQQHQHAAAGQLTLAQLEQAARQLNIQLVRNVSPRQDDLNHSREDLDSPSLARKRITSTSIPEEQPQPPKRATKQGAKEFESLLSILWHRCYF
jgi:hypothetical protein